MNQQEPDLERRVSALQSQLDRLTESLHQWRDDQHSLQPMENRLSELTQQCAEILDRWTLTDLRHTHAVGEMEARLNAWDVIENRFREDAHQRVRDLENRIEHEWDTLRQMFDRPVKELEDHAVSLRETSIAAASSALSSLERAEGRLAALEAGLTRQMNQLSREVHAAIAEIGVNGHPRTLQQGVETWPLDSVKRLHDDLRGLDSAGTAAADAAGQLPQQIPQTITVVPESRPQLAERIESVEQSVLDAREEAHEASAQMARSRWASRFAFVVLGAVLITAGVSGYRLQRRVEATVADAAARVATAEREREAATEATEQQRKDADVQIATARDIAARAQVISDVLAAPDLVRYNLVGGNAAPRAGAQALWSRSRGLVFSASRVPPAPPNSSYQLWLLTTGGPVSASLVTPDAEGRVSLVTQDPPDVPRQVVGFALSLESAAGSSEPTGSFVMGPRPVTPAQ